eukprot:tig00020553_g10713.t1
MGAWVYWRDLPRRSRFLACSKFLRLTGYFPPFPFAGSQTVPRLAFSDDPRGVGTLHSRLGDVPTVLHALRAFGPTGARQLELFEFHTLAYPLGVPLVFPAASFDDDAAWRVTHELLPWEFAAGLAGAGMIHAWLHDSEKQKFSKAFGTGLQPWFRDFVRAFTGQEQGAASGIAELRTALRNDYAAALGLCPGPSRAAPSRSWPASLQPLDLPDSEIPWDQLVEPWGLAETHFHLGAIEEAWNSPGRKGRSLYARPPAGQLGCANQRPTSSTSTPAPTLRLPPSRTPPPRAPPRRLQLRVPPPLKAADAATGDEGSAPPPAEKPKKKTKAPAQPRRTAPPKPASSAEEEAPEEPAPRPAKPAKRKRRPVVPEDDFSDDDWGPPQRRRAASPPPPASGDEGEESEDDSDPDPEPKVVAAAPKRRSATKEIVRLPPPLTESERLAAIQRSREEAQAAAGAKPLAAAARHLLAVLPPRAAPATGRAPVRPTG